MSREPDNTPNSHAKQAVMYKYLDGNILKEYKNTYQPNNCRTWQYLLVEFEYQTDKAIADSVISTNNIVIERLHNIADKKAIKTVAKMIYLLPN